MVEITSDFEAEVNELHFADGAHVRADDQVITLSVCKMLTPLYALGTGTITYCCAVGDYVQQGQTLARIE